MKDATRKCVAVHNSQEAILWCVRSHSNPPVAFTVKHFSHEMENTGKQSTNDTFSNHSRDHPRASTAQVYFAWLGTVPGLVANSSEDCSYWREEIQDERDCKGGEHTEQDRTFSFLLIVKYITYSVGQQLAKDHLIEYLRKCQFIKINIGLCI